MEEQNPLDVIDSSFAQVKKDLKEYSNSWAAEVAESIGKDDELSDEMKAEVNLAKVRNVVNGIVRNGQWKAIVYKHMKQLLAEHKDKVSKIIQ